MNATFFETDLYFSNFKSSLLNLNDSFQIAILAHRLQCPYFPSYNLQKHRSSLFRRFFHSAAYLLTVIDFNKLLARLQAVFNSS